MNVSVYLHTLFNTSYIRVLLCAVDGGMSFYLVVVVLEVPTYIFVNVCIRCFFLYFNWYLAFDDIGLKCDTLRYLSVWVMSFCGYDGTFLRRHYIWL